MVTIKPAAVLKWHRRLHRRKWNYSQRVVDEYVAYYNERCHHQSLDLNTPIQKLIPKSILTVKGSAEIESLMVLSSITDSLPE